MVRISRSHRDGRGSIPRLGRRFCFASMHACVAYIFVLQPFCLLDASHCHLCTNFSYDDNNTRKKRQKSKIRCEQGSNLRGKIPLDFKSNALTTRPSQHAFYGSPQSSCFILRSLKRDEEKARANSIAQSNTACPAQNLRNFRLSGRDAVMGSIAQLVRASA